MTEEAKKERLALILELREKERMTYRSISARLGVGVQRARQIYEEAVERRSWAPDDPRRWLSGKVCNLLRYHDIESREAALASFAAGRMRRFSRNGQWGEARGWRGLGKKSLAQIAAWAGFELPERAKKKVRVCPHCGGELR